MSLSPMMLNEVAACLPVQRDAVMIFGSAARDDMVWQSDVDVLVVRQGKTGTFRCGRVNLSYYAPAHLQKMAREGSLFIRHLIMDGAPVEDPHGILAERLAGYVRPQTYMAFRQALCSIMPLFDVDESCFEKYAHSYVAVALFCLRTAVYLKADDQNLLSFSLRELENKTRWPEVTLLRRVKRNQPTNSWCDFRDLVAALENELGTVATNLFLTPEAYITNTYDRWPIVLALGLRLLAGENVPMNYDLLSPLALVS